MMKDDLHGRLRVVREERGLSLREMAARLLEGGGHDTSHDSVRRYEEGRTIPSEYLVAVCEAFQVSPEWLLFGRGSMRSRSNSDASAALEAVGEIIRAFQSEKQEWQAAGWTAAAKKRWRQFVSTLGPGHPLHRASIHSWQPPPGEGKDGGVKQIFQQIGEDELRQSQANVRHLSDILAPHFEWLALLFRDLDHVVALTDADGIILESRGRPSELTREWKMEPGFDWSEGALGGTGVAHALASGCVSAVIGTEAEPFHQFACVAVPLRGLGNSIVGVLNLSTRVRDADPQRMGVLAYTAWMIELEGNRHPSV